jgi:hypothetical protein
MSQLHCSKAETVCPAALGFRHKYSLANCHWEPLLSTCLAESCLDVPISTASENNWTPVWLIVYVQKERQIYWMIRCRYRYDTSQPSELHLAVTQSTAKMPSHPTPRSDSWRGSRNCSKTQSNVPELPKWQICHPWSPTSGFFRGWHQYVQQHRPANRFNRLWCSLRGNFYDMIEE